MTKFHSKNLNVSIQEHRYRGDVKRCEKFCVLCVQRRWKWWLRRWLLNTGDVSERKDWDLTGGTSYWAMCLLAGLQENIRETARRKPEITYSRTLLGRTVCRIVELRLNRASMHAMLAQDSADIPANKHVLPLSRHQYMHGDDNFHFTELPHV
jgi:hypothetical protein